MPAGDAGVLRVDDQERGPLGLDEIRGNSTEVIEDHHRFKEVQAQRAEGVRPKKFDDLMAGEYGLPLVPIPEEEVAGVTMAAARAMGEERARAGGVLPPESRTLLPGPSAPEEGGPSPGAASRVAAPAGHLVDFIGVAQRMEGRVSELQGAITGLAMRVEALSRGAQSAIQTGEASARALDSNQQKPQGGPVAGVMSLQERRERRSQGGGPAKDQPLASEVRAELPAQRPNGAAPPVPERKAWGLGPARKRLTALLMDRRVGGAVVGVLVAAGAAVLLLGQKGGRMGENALVECQVQGFGVYVRTEQAELMKAIQMESNLAREAELTLADLARAHSDFEGRRLRKRLEEIQKLQERAQRAKTGLQVLEEISGVRQVGLP